MAGSRSRVALLLLFVFAAGAAAGVAADRLALLPDLARADEPSAYDDDGERSGRQTTIERFADDLGLTTRQRAEIEEILEEFRSDVKAMRSEFAPRWHALLDTARTRIEAQLTEAQVEQYRALLEQRRERRREDDRERRRGDDAKPDHPDGERDDGKREGEPRPGGDAAGEEGGR